MSYFVSVTKHSGKAVISVEGNRGISCFPLTVKGCRDAGSHLRIEEQKHWLCSSSVDNPQEYKKSFRGNVSELILDGFNSCIDYHQVDDEVMSAWLAFKATNPTFTASFVSFVAGWNADKAFATDKKF